MPPTCLPGTILIPWGSRQGGPSQTPEGSFLSGLPAPYLLPSLADVGAAHLRGSQRKDQEEKAEFAFLLASACVSGSTGCFSVIKRVKNNVTSGVWAGPVGLVAVFRTGAALGGAVPPLCHMAEQSASPRRVPREQGWGLSERTVFRKLEAASGLACGSLSLA